MCPLTFYLLQQKKTYSINLSIQMNFLHHPSVTSSRKISTRLFFEMSCAFLNLFYSPSKLITTYSMAKQGLVWLRGTSKSYPKLRSKMD